MRSFRLLTCAIFVAATVPRLAHRGMFVDGVTYASIARNLAEGRGTFWTPSYTATIYPQFHDHPPLGFWLQSLWFRALGDHLYVERLYAVAGALATAALLAAFWRRLEKRGRAYPTPFWGLEWLPILFWVAVPVVSWSIVGNLLETTVAVFTTGAILAVFGGVTAATPTAAAAWGLVSGLSIVAAFLTKGPVGLFPLAAPVVFSFLPNARRRSAVLAAQWSTVAACGAALALLAASRSSLTEYLRVQILAALTGSRETSGSSLTIVKDLVQAVLLPMTALGVVAAAAARRFVAPSEQIDRRRALLFLVLGLAGTLPILVSAKQAGHYVVPAVPMFALASAIVLAPTVRAFVDRFGVACSRFLFAISVILLAGAFAAAASPGIGRDRTRLANLDVLEAAAPLGETIGICPEANDDWGLHAWFERRFRASLDAGRGGRHDILLKTASPRNGCPPAECTAITDPAQSLVLMRCPRSE